MFAETKPGWFRITVWVALASTSTKRCWSSGRTVKTLMRVTTSLSFEIVTIRYLPPPASCAVLPLKDSLYLKHEHPPQLKPAWEKRFYESSAGRTSSWTATTALHFRSVAERHQSLR